MKEIIDKLDFSKIKNFCSAKDNVKRMREQAIDWKKILTKDTFDKGPLSKIYQELLKLKNKKTTQLKNWAKGLNRHLTKEDTQMANKHMKRCSTSYVIREMQIKTMVYHCIPIRMAEIQNTDTTKCW